MNDRDEFAFPGFGVTQVQPGMTLCDHFAIKALQGLLTSPNDLVQALSGVEMATRAYDLADVMIFVRSTREKSKGNKT